MPIRFWAGLGGAGSIRHEPKRLMSNAALRGSLPKCGCSTRPMLLSHLHHILLKGLVSTLIALNAGQLSPLSSHLQVPIFFG
jgi:hypothetical protein